MRWAAWELSPNYDCAGLHRGGSSPDADWHMFDILQSEPVTSRIAARYFLRLTDHNVAISLFVSASETGIHSGRCWAGRQ